MRKAVLGLAGILAAMITSHANTAEFTAKDLAAEEGKFAAFSVKNGMRAAFIEFFADDSVLLRPDPVNGQTHMRAATDPPIVLDWKSQITVMSASHDLGMSTGPSKVLSKTDPSTPPSYGQFFSVWQKQKNGDWKVLLDHGIGHGNSLAPDLPLAAYDLVPASGAPAVAGDSGEKRFVLRTAEIGAAKAYAESVTNQTRLIRGGRVPIDGSAAIGEYVKTIEGKWTWQTLKEATSKANDFAYSLGTYSWQPAEGAAQKGHYIRVWTRDAKTSAGRWILAGEVLTPRPPPPKS